jgi:hypothetical protein
MTELEERDIIAATTMYAILIQGLPQRTRRRPG